MLVCRRTFIVKKPFFEEALAMLKETRQLAKQVLPTIAYRVYACELGPFDTIAFEVEYASLSAYEQEEADFYAHPAVAPRWTEWFKRWNEVTEPGGSNEIWRLVE